MDGPQERKGNPPETIEYSGLKVGDIVPLEKKPRKW